MKCVIAMCGGKKKDEECPAIEMYRGGLWNVIRKNDKGNMDIYVLSAKYGLINARTTIIKPYDLFMKDVNTDEMKNHDSWKQLNLDKYEETLISVSKNYLEAIPDFILNHKNVIMAPPRLLSCFKKTKEFLMEVDSRDLKP